MVQLVLPKNSAVTEGRTFSLKTGASAVKRFRVYRWNPDSQQIPRVDTYEVDLDTCDR